MEIRKQRKQDSIIIYYRSYFSGLYVVLIENKINIHMHMMPLDSARATASSCCHVNHSEPICWDNIGGSSSGQPTRLYTVLMYAFDAHNM